MVDELNRWPLCHYFYHYVFTNHLPWDQHCLGIREVATLYKTWREDYRNMYTTRKNVERVVEIERTGFQSWEERNCNEPVSSRALLRSHRSYSDVKPSVGYQQVQRRISPGKHNCRSHLGITRRYSDILGSGRTSGLLGLYWPLSSLDHSIVYLKYNLHLWLLKHKVSQVVCVSLWERKRVCACVGLYQEWLDWVPELVGPITLWRGPLCSPLALGNRKGPKSSSVVLIRGLIVLSSCSLLKPTGSFRRNSF